ncbi:hypothetical protein OIU85_003367 [Salix viminalis]|uniref:F-box domain-containing protein n=1 Tax=Salix viminalis TaxID=40686 RepID=A0A9Q0PZF2_SALVM|nr:hypothetical protein OIU85_003367 [Salix viminalis]
MIADILSRLPVKTLLRFKSVCKSWRCMIGDSSLGFQALHYDRSQRKPRFLLQWPDFDFRPLEPAGCRLPRFALLSYRNTYSCVSTLALAILLLCRLTEVKQQGFGIGYLSPAKGHVVVRLNIPRQSRTSLSRKLECSVFTFLPENGGARWRAVEDGCPYLVEQFSFPAFANETIYWKIDRGKHQALHRQNDFIVSFNIRDEKFQTITHPADWRPETHRQWRSPVRISTQLVELRGHLYLVETAAFSYVAVWKLSDPGNSTWSKACTIDISKFHPSFVGEIQCVKGTEIIFNSCTRLLLYYDEKNKTSRRKMLPCSAANLTIYCESLTFPATQQV